MIKLSVIIPSYHDLVNKTAQSLLDNSELGKDELEIICVFDGYWEKPIDDPQIKVLHLGKSRGMRGAINAGVAIAKGEFLMRTDAHCSFAKGFDRIITETCEPNWIVSGRQVYLDIKKWKRMNIPPIDHQKLVIQSGKKFSGIAWKERDEEMKDVMISEMMAMQGSVWVMPHSWWDKVIGELQVEGYGNLIQDSTEMIFKTWQAGGKMMLNKNTWFAHRHRDFGRTHDTHNKENPANCEAGYKYALDTWSDYYYKVICPKWGLKI